MPPQPGSRALTQEAFQSVEAAVAQTLGTIPGIAVPEEEAICGYGEVSAFGAEVEIVDGTRGKGLGLVEPARRGSKMRTGPSADPAARRDPSNEKVMAVIAAEPVSTLACRLPGSSAFRITSSRRAFHLDHFRGGSEAAQGKVAREHLVVNEPT